jgi:hypothetical protein
MMTTDATADGSDPGLRSLVSEFDSRRWYRVHVAERIRHPFPKRVYGGSSPSVDTMKDIPQEEWLDCLLEHGYDLGAK